MAADPRLADKSDARRELPDRLERVLPLGASFERLDDHGRSVGVDGVPFHRAEPTVGRVMSVFGPVGHSDRGGPGHRRCPVGPLLRAAADAAPDNWTWLDKLGPDRSLVDAWHAVQHLKECADDAFGKDTAKGRTWFGKHRTILLEDAKGIGRTIDAIRHLVSSGRGGAILGRELEFFRRNRARMDHRAARDAGCPIGSGCVEAANKYLVQQRMKRSGRRWGREGGQGVLTFRSLLKSGRFDEACRSMVRRRRANAPVRLPAPAPKLALAA